MYKNHRTLRKRIARGMKFSTIISIFFFSFMIIGVIGIFVRLTGYFICYLTSANIVREVSSQYFAQSLGVNGLKEINVTTPGLGSWQKDLESRLLLNNLLKYDIMHEINLPLQESINFVDVVITVGDEPGDAKNIFNNSPERALEEKRLDSLRSMDPRTLKFTEKRDLWFDEFFGRQVSLVIKNNTAEKVGMVYARLNQDVLRLIFLGFTVIFVLMGLIAIFIAGTIANIFSKPIILPLSRLQDKMDAIANGNLEEFLDNPIVMKKPLREIESLLYSTNTIISKIKGYTKLLENQNSELEAMANDQREINDILGRRNNQLQNILDNVGQGFLTFGSDLIINEECSLECHKIFDNCITGKVLSDMLYSDNKEQKKFLDSVFLKILSEIETDKIDLYIHLLPEEIEINSKNISFEYKLVKNIDAEHQKCIMVILTDVTEKRVLEQKMEDEKNVLRMVVKTVVHYNDFIQCIDDYETFVYEDLPILLNASKSIDEIISDIYRNVHNFKGNFSQYDTQNLVNKLHILEERINEFKNGDSTNIHQLAEIIKSADMYQWLNEELQVLQNFLGEDFFNKKDTLLIDKKTLIKIEEKMVKVLPTNEYKLLLPDLRRLRYKPFKELLSGYPDYLDKLAERLGKSIDLLIIRGDEMLVDIDYYRDFAKSLVHVFRNCLDHGIESIEDRVLQGKHESGSIRCSIENGNNNIKLTISDDGQGINIDSIKEKAISLGFLNEGCAENLSNNEILNFIFKEDFTLKEDVTEISGRGIGLFSVIKELSKLNGTAEVNSELGKGTEFVFTLPLMQIDYVPHISIRNIIGTLVNTASFFINDITKVELGYSFDIIHSDKVNLNTISALINITGAVHGVIIISFNEKLAAKLVQDFIIDEVNQDDVSEYVEDVVAECSNIILGNSIKHFGEIEDLVSIGTPTIVCYKGASIRYSDSNMISCQLKKDDFEVSFSFVCIDEIIPEEEEI